MVGRSAAIWYFPRKRNEKVIHALRKLDLKLLFGKDKGQDILDFLPPYNHFTSSTGRQGIKLFLDLIKFNKGDKVLLPSYTAEGAIKPFKVSGANILFYKLDDHLQPDIADILVKINNDPGIRLLLVIHPFGIRIDLKDVVDRAREKKIIIMEDCVQGLFSDYARENYGDVLFFSLNKYFPVIDGAFFFIRNADIKIKGIKYKKNPLLMIAGLFYLIHLFMNEILFYTKNKVVGRGLATLTGRLYDMYYIFINNIFTPSQMSHLSNVIIKKIDLKECFISRKRNLRILYEGLKNANLKLIYQFREGDVPLLVPALVTGPLNRDEFIRGAFERGIALATLTDKWDFIPDRKVFHNESRYIDNHILIPINESIDEASMRKMVDELNRIGEK
jgi:hypothetical protein